MTALAADTPDLSIVLVNWNACEMTSAALESIAAHTRDIRYEIFVIDNGSTRDRSVEELPRRFPSMAFIPNAGNMGFSIANNQGVARARGRYVLLLNNDTIQTENALGAAVRYMDAHAEVGALGILHRNADAQRSEQPSAFGFPRPWREVATLVGVRWSGEYGAPFRADVEQRRRLGVRQLSADAPGVPRADRSARRAVLHLRRGHRLVPPGTHGRLDGPVLARGVDGARGRVRASVHEGQDVRALPQPPLVHPEASFPGSGGAVLPGDGGPSDARDALADRALAWRRGVAG